jgi:hypothetical protein
MTCLHGSLCEADCFSVEWFVASMGGCGGLSRSQRSARHAGGTHNPPSLPVLISPFVPTNFYLRVRAVRRVQYDFFLASRHAYGRTPA